MYQNFHRLALYFLLGSLSLLFIPAFGKTTTQLTVYSYIKPNQIQSTFYQSGLNKQNLYFSEENLPGFAMVRLLSSYDLNAPSSQVTLTVPALIDPSTVIVKTNKNIHLLKQTFHYDLQNSMTLLNRYLDKNFTLPELSGKLIGFDSKQIFLKTNDGTIHVLDHPKQFPELPEAIFTKPTLQWQLTSKKSGSELLDISYKTQGMTWWCDYNVLYDESKQSIDLNAWVSIVNRSGATFDEAKLKLVAGDVHTIEAAPKMRMMESMDLMTTAVAPGGNESFTQEKLFEYYLYTLKRPTTLLNQTTQQLEFFPTIENIPVEKVLVYNGAGQDSSWPIYNPRTYNAFQNQNNKVEVFLQFKNDEQHQLGFALPQGRIRVNKSATNKQDFELIGEDSIEHTAKNETLLLKLGSAFDIKGTRTQLDFAVREKDRWMSESIKITLTNHKDNAVVVQVQEPLNRWKQWEITQSSMPHKKINSQMIEFDVAIPANQTHEVKYDVKYSW